jgi:1-phosphatidylinositol-4-phosphate 5-kinase
MPSLVTEGPLSTLSTSANSSFDGPRKSHEKTLGGVFTYTNGTNVETGLSDHRLDQFKNAKHNSSLHSLPNGTSSGSINGTRDRAHSKTGSIQSIGSGAGRHWENTGRTPGSSDGLTKLSNVEHAQNDYLHGRPQTSERPADPERLRSSTSTRGHGDNWPLNATTTSVLADAPTSYGAPGSTLSPPSGHQPSLNRFSSQSGMSPGATQQDRLSGDISKSMEMPRLSHRHTLQVPKATSTYRASRDFSFTGGASEEALSATGRFSPAKDENTLHHRHRRASLGVVRRATRSLVSDSHLPDDPPPDEDALRWTEALKAKRASKRKQKEEEDEDRVIVGKKVDEGHVNWITAYNMLTGIRFTVSRTNAKIDRELTDADFTSRHKFSFDITGNELTPSAKYDFKFKDYSPWVFRHLRAIFGLDPADYLMSLTSKYILSELGSPGKSGSFFYFSRDYKYIIKTIHHAEHKLLRRILREYYDHVVDHPNTLISQFYGLHRVKIPYGRKIHFVVMNNLFPPHRDIHQMFDLKGSTIGRDFKEADLEHNPRATLKDLNWLRRNLHLEFDDKVKQLFVEQMKRDVALLQKLKIMDYSLLVGVHDLEKGNEENVREKTLRVFQPGGERNDSDLEGRMLVRTPSRLENQKKARELRLTLKKEKPVPMGLVHAKMPDEIASADERRDRLFYSYDGGIRATHEDGRGGEEVYYLGIIDCLTYVSSTQSSSCTH